MPRRHWRSGALGIAAALALAVPAVTPAADATTPAAVGSPMTLWAPDKVVAYSYDGQVYTDFGLRLVATTDPVEVRSTRTSYDDPIVSEWLSPAGARSLPDDLAMADFTGLTGFADLTITRVDSGRQVGAMDLDVCLNGYAQRVRPDAPAHSPYPHGCPWNPYTLGSVMGLEAGYASPLVQQWDNNLVLPPGRYDVTATVTPDFADFFGIAEADARRTTRLVVKKDGGGKFRPHAARRDEPAAAPAAHEPSGSSAGAATGPTPDLRSLPAFGVTLNRKGTLLRFAATVWNAGASPLVVDGFRVDGADRMDAYQYFFDAAGNQTGYQQVGEMHWHAQNHQHWHFEDFARYRLLNEDLSEAVASGKRSFCLANTDAVDYTLPGADWHPENTDLSTACGGRDALSVREVLAAGSGDTYLQYRYGQAFPIKDVADGTYWIAVEANPVHAGGTRHLVESDYANNDSLRRIRITTDKHGNRQVKAFRVGIVDEPDQVGH